MNKLSNFDLQSLLGGAAVTREEYCATLDKIISDNWEYMTPGEKDGAMYGWNTYCAGN